MLTKNQCQEIAANAVLKFIRRNKKLGWEKEDIVLATERLNGTENDMFRVMAFATEIVLGEHKS